MKEETKKALKVIGEFACMVTGYEISVNIANNLWGAGLPRTIGEVTPSNAWYPTSFFGTGTTMILLSLL